MKFEELYMYMLENYDFFSEIPAAEFGLKTKIVHIPMDAPYGFWADRSGNFIPVTKQGGHEIIARNIIEKAKQFIHLNKKQTESAYEYLFDQGWVRLVCDKPKKRVLWEKTHGIKPTPYQNRFMEFIKDYYDFIKVEEG